MKTETFYEFNPNIKAVISKNIRIARKKLHLTQEQVALRAEISYDFMRRIESGHGDIGFSIQTLYKIAIVLNASVDELMELPKKEVI